MIRNVRLSQLMSNLIKISAPHDHKPERNYVFQVLFNDWMGLTYEVEWVDATSTILTSAGRQMVIPDLFFFSLPEVVEWSDLQVPTELHWLDPIDEHGDRIPSFFGSVWENERSEDVLALGCDVFAHAFFHLTRWEEIGLKHLDRFGRIDESALLALQHGVHYMPSLDMLFHRLSSTMETFLRLKVKDQHPYSIKVTHDVDHLRRFDTVKKWVNAIGGDLLLRKKPWLVFKTTWEFISIQLKLRKDNYDSFDALMDRSESLGLKSHFYFIPSHAGEEDVRYDIRSRVAQETIHSIQKRGHTVGVHGSFASAWDKEVFKQELARLHACTPEVSEGRMHYLRFKNPHTWQMWEEAGLQRDSSLGLSSDIGFRCGTARPYRVFDLQNRKTLSLIEEPLIVMEVALIRKYPKAEEGLNAARQVVDMCERYGGQLVYLWHPENLDHPHWGQYAHLYEAILSYAAKEQA